MREDFIHYLWRHQRFAANDLSTTTGESVSVIHPGQQNQNDGPDFLGAQIRLGPILWAGAVEIHVKSSDWYAHRHQHDKNYQSVILHVVWEDDLEVVHPNGSLLATLELSPRVPQRLVQSYRHFFINIANSLPCQNHPDRFPQTRWNLFLERIYVERLARKSKSIQKLLKEKNNDWDAVLFVLLAKNFGLNINGEAFAAVAQQIPFAIVRKFSRDASTLEALFLGQSGLLTAATSGDYPKRLWQQYHYLKQKHSLADYVGPSFHFSGLRPANFPTLRWVQFAQLCARSSHLLADFFHGGKLTTKWLEKLQVSSFWEEHYTFHKTAKKRLKPLTKKFIDLIKINTLVPFYFCYLNAQGREATEDLLEWMSQIPPEKNQSLAPYEALGVKATSALQSQALLTLSSNYCQQKKCLLCNVGVYLLKKEA